MADDKALARRLVEACRYHKHPSRSLSDAISKLVTHGWADDDPRWETFGWPHWTASEGGARDLAEAIGLWPEIEVRKGTFKHGLKTYPLMASHKPTHHACVGRQRSTAACGAVLKTWKGVT